MNKIIVPILIFAFILFIFLSSSFKSKELDIPLDNPVKIQEEVPKTSKNVIYSFTIVSDSHVNTPSLSNALNVSKENKVDFVLHAGDLSDFGTMPELKDTQKVLEESGIEYYVIPGDRDLYNNSEENTVAESTIFYDIFGDRVCRDQLIEKYKLSCVINPYNYNLISNDSLESFKTNILSSKIIITSQPLYNPNSNIYMGFYDKSVLKQAGDLLATLRNSNVFTVFSGDAHFFSFYEDSLNKERTFYTLGALAKERNIQEPNFIIVTVYSDYSVFVEQFYAEENQ